MPEHASAATNAPATSADEGIRLSGRVARMKPSSTLALTARVKELRAAGRDVIGFGAGEPDFDTPAPLVEAASAALHSGRTRYEPVPGPPETRRAVAERFAARHDVACDANDVVLTVGGKSAIFFALLALIDPGVRDEVVVPTPAWVSYRPMIELLGGRMVEVPGEASDGFRLHADRIAAAVTPRSAALLLNSPSNPCGTMYPAEDLEAVAGVVAGHPRMAVISDELYERIVFGDIAHRAFASIPGMAARTITIGGMSKAFAMTGWRLGWAISSAPDLAKAIATIQGQVTSHATAFCYPAIDAAMSGVADADVERMRRTFAERARLMHGRLVAIEGVTCPEPTGAFYCFPDVSCCFGRRTPDGRAIQDAAGFAEALLEEAEVAVVPGGEFGGGGERHVRLSFACSDEMIRTGCDRIARFIASLA